MTRPTELLTDDEMGRCAPAGDDDAGFGALNTPRGPLPLKAMTINGRIDGLLAQVTVQQTFVNALDEPLEATYIFPLPDRAAVTGFRMEVAGRTVEGVLEERGQARREYQQAIEAGHRASIAEEERPGVFSLRVGNLMPGEEATVTLTLTGPLPYADGEVTFRFPLVVAPRYVPGQALAGPQVGLGVAADTDAVPDASRISPPVLLPGFPNPVRLALSVDVHACGLPITGLRTSLHATRVTEAEGLTRVRLQPGERLNRDFVLRFRLGTERVASALSLHPDGAGADGAAEGTFALTIVPPAGSGGPDRPRDVVFVLDRSGSMEGWKIVAARRAVARMVDTLGERDRFQVLAFDDTVESPPGLPAEGLAPASNRNRFRAVEYLATVGARGGTRMNGPLERAAARLAGCPAEHDRIIVLVTDGQVANEDQLLRTLGPMLGGIRVFALGIDRAVNEGFLRRLAGLGGGDCDVVESEDRLDEVMDAIHRRIGPPLLRGLTLGFEGLELVPGTLVPARLPDLFAGAPVLVLGRYRGGAEGTIVACATSASDEPWSQAAAGSERPNPAIAAAWARGLLRQLEDRFLTARDRAERNELEHRIIAASLRHGVLCRFTAYVAVDRSEVANAGGRLHQVVQPVEQPEGWEMRGPAMFGSISQLRKLSMPPPAKKVPVNYPSRGRSSAASGPPARASLDHLECRAATAPSASPDFSGVFQSLPGLPEDQPTPEQHAGGPVPLSLEPLWTRLRRSLGLGGKRWPRSLDLASCRVLAGDLADRISALAARTLPPQRREWRRVERELAALIAALGRLGASADAQALQPVLDDLRVALPARGALSQSDLAALGARAVAALRTLAAAGPAPAPPAPRKEDFWK